MDTHPGLAFLQSAPEFHARYVETVSTFVIFFVCVCVLEGGRVVIAFTMFWHNDVHE